MVSKAKSDTYLNAKSSYITIVSSSTDGGDHSYFLSIRPWAHGTYGLRGLGQRAGGTGERDGQAPQKGERDGRAEWAGGQSSNTFGLVM